MHILRQSLQKLENLYAYLFSTLASRYSVFLAGLKIFWERIISEVHPSDKIKILQLKSSLFDGASILKTKYFETHLLKQLSSVRLQIFEMLEDTKENMDKYTFVTSAAAEESKNSEFEMIDHDSDTKSSLLRTQLELKLS